MTDFSIAGICANASMDEHRSKVFEFERAMLAAPQVELRVEHIYGDGWYAREMHVPAGVIVSGAVHRFINSNMLARGEMILASEDGLMHVKAPYYVVSPPGTKRIAQTMTDCVWVTYLATDERDPEKIEALFTTNDEQEYLAMQKNPTLEGK